MKQEPIFIFFSPYTPYMSRMVHPLPTGHITPRYDASNQIINCVTGVVFLQLTTDYITNSFRVGADYNVVISLKQETKYFLIMHVFKRSAEGSG
jgi:hypothetical protein